MQSEFCRVIGGRKRSSNFAANGRRDGHFSRLFRDKMRHDDARQIEQAENVAVEHIVVHFQVDVEEVSSLRAASIVNQNIQLNNQINNHLSRKYTFRDSGLSQFTVPKCSMTLSKHS